MIEGFFMGIVFCGFMAWALRGEIGFLNTMALAIGLLSVFWLGGAAERGLTQWPGGIGLIVAFSLFLISVRRQT